MTCAQFCKLYSFLSLSSSLFAEWRWEQLPLTFWVASSQCDVEKVKKKDWNKSKNECKDNLQVWAISLLKLSPWDLPCHCSHGRPSERCLLNHTEYLRKSGQHFLNSNSVLLPSFLHSPDERNRKTFWNHIQANLLGLFQIKPKSGTDPCAGALSLRIATKLHLKKKKKKKKKKERKERKKKEPTKNAAQTKSKFYYVHGLKALGYVKGSIPVCLSDLC